MLKYDPSLDAGGEACASSIEAQLGYLREGLEEVGRGSRDLEEVQKLVVWIGDMRWILKEEGGDQEVRVVGIGLTLENTRLHAGRRAYWFGEGGDVGFEGYGGTAYGKRLHGGVAVVVRGLCAAKVKEGKGRKRVAENVVLSGAEIERLKPCVQALEGGAAVPEQWRMSWLKCDVLRCFPFWYREAGDSFYKRVGFEGVGCQSGIVLEGFGGPVELSVVVKGSLAEEGRVLAEMSDAGYRRLVEFRADVSDGVRMPTKGDWLGTYFLVNGSLRRALDRVRLLSSISKLRRELGAAVRVVANRSSIWLICEGVGEGVAWVLGWHAGDKEYENAYGTLVVGWPEGGGDFPLEDQLDRLNTGLVATPVQVWGGGRECWLEGSLEGETFAGMKLVRAWLVEKARQGSLDMLRC